MSKIRSKMVTFLFSSYFCSVSYLELWQPLCSVGWNQLCNIGKRHHQEQSCEIILDLDQRFRSSDIPPVQWSGTIYAILKEGIMGNVRVKKYEIRTSG